MATTVSFEGFPEFEKALKKLEDLGTKGDFIMEDALKEGAKIVQDEAMKRAPHKTYKLRDNIKIGDIRETKRGMNIVVGPTKGDISEVFYGKFSEFGTSREPARPWLRPALDRKKNEIQQKMMDIIMKGIEDTVQGGG